MNYQFNIENYNAFFNRLKNFAGNDDSVESYYRNIFKDNMARILSSVSQVELEEYNIYKLNKIIEDILDYKILLEDIYEIVGNIFYKVNDFIEIFYEYSSSANKDLDKIYTLEFNVGEKDKSSILDMFFKNIKNMELVDHKVYLTPVIEYSYSLTDSENGFRNELKAFTEFYSNNYIKNAINSGGTFINHELQELKNSLITDYKNCRFPLYLLDMQKTQEYVFVFFKNLILNSDNITYDTLHPIYRDNSHLFDIANILETLQLSLHREYYIQVSDFNYRDLIFDPKNYIHNLHPKNMENITLDSFGYNLMLSIISPAKSDKDKLISYITELGNFKNYIDGIYYVVSEQFGRKIKLGG